MEARDPDRSDTGASRSSEDVAADVFDFVQDFLADEERSAARPLADYLARYPGAESAIAAEYLALTGSGDSDPAPEPADEDPPASGEKRLGRYVLERRLGQGGQGEVWLARDPSLQRRVALKVSSALFVTEEQRQRFRREAESIARLEHPGLAQVFEADVDASPPYIAMRYVEGVDMRTSLARELEREGDGAVPPLVPWVPRRRRDVVRVLRFFERCARALHAAHDGGVLHRDVKPGNVMVTPEGEPVLLDFGLARARTPAGDNELTREGDVFGTLAYMAPEQLRGDVGAIAAGTDVYALGATLFEALTGERPFGGASPSEIAVAIETGRRSDARALNPALGEDVGVVLATALEPAPERRYASALELAEDLRRIAEFEPIHARPAGPLLRARRWARREPAWAAALGVTLLALVAWLVISEKNNRETRRLLGETVADQALLKVPELITSAPAGALAFVRAAVELNDGWRARSALVDPLLEVSLERRYALPAKRPRALVREPGGTFLVGGSGPYLARFDPCAGADAPPVAEADVAGDVRSAARAGRLVVVGTAAGEVCVLDAATLAELRRVFVGDGGVLGVDVEGTVAVAATADAVVAFDAETGAVLGRFERKGAAFAEVALVGAPAVRVVASPRGFLGARGGQGTRAWVLDLPALTSPVAFEHGARVRALGVAEDVPLAATVDADGRLRLIDVERAALVPIGGAESVAVDGTTPGMAVALDAGGTRVAVGLDRVAELRARSGSGAAHAGRWEAEPTRAAPSLVVFALARDGADGGLSVVDAPLRLDAGTRVSAVAFDPSGARVAAGGWSTTLGVWDARTGEQRAAHRDWNRPDTFHWAEDGSRIVSVGIAESVEVWRERPLAGALRFDPIIDSGPEEPAPLVYGAFVPGTRGRRVVLCDAFGRAALFASPPVPGGGPSAESDERRRFGARIQRLDVAPVGRAPDAARVHVAAAAARVAWLGATGELRVWDVTLGAPALLLDGTVEGFSGGPHFVALDPAGGRVAAVDRSGAVFEGPVDGALRRLRAEPAELVLYAPDGASLFAVARDGALARVATVPDGPSVEYETHGSGRPDRAFDLALSEDGAEVVVAFGRNELVGWDTGTGEVVRSGGRPSPRRFLRYGAQRTLVSAGRGPGTLQVLRDVELPGPKEVPGADVRSLDLSDDGSTAAVATSDGWVIVWDVATGRPLLAPQVHPGGGRAVDLDGVGDGARILSVGADGAALWPLDVLGLATEVAPRGPNRYERGLLENAEEFLR